VLEPELKPILRKY